MRGCEEASEHLRKVFDVKRKRDVFERRHGGFIQEMTVLFAA